MIPSRQKILLTMINAATAAGAEIVKVKSGQYSVREKADLSPVTDADYAAQNTIAAALFPLGIPMISEESAAADFSVRGLWDQVFIIDPLDGTKEFINGSHQYGVNIAWVEQGTPVAGVIFLPEDGLLYVGATDFPAMRIECAAGQQFDSLEQLQGVKLPCGPYPDHYVLLVSKSRRTPQMEVYIEDFARQHPQAEILPMASCVKYCAIAEGRAHRYTRYGSVMEWDTAAGDALLRSLGLALRSIADGKPLEYNKAVLHSSDFTVSRDGEHL